MAADSLQVRKLHISVAKPTDFFLLTAHIYIFHAFVLWQRFNKGCFCIDFRYIDRVFPLERKAYRK